MIIRGFFSEKGVYTGSVYPDPCLLYGSTNPSINYRDNGLLECTGNELNAGNLEGLKRITYDKSEMPTYGNAILLCSIKVGDNYLNAWLAGAQAPGLAIYSWQLQFQNETYNTQVISTLINLTFGFSYEHQEGIAFAFGGVEGYNTQGVPIFDDPNFVLFWYYIDENGDLYSNYYGYGIGDTETLKEQIPLMRDIDQDLLEWDTEDPYTKGGTSKPGGNGRPGSGNGSYDFDSDEQELPDLDTLLSVGDTDLVSVFAPTRAQLRSLASFLWTDDFINAIKKLKGDPFDCIIGLHIVPLTVTGAAATLHVGNVDTEISMTKSSKQFYEVNCGTLNLAPIWDAYLDYQCRIDIYLPFCGIHRLQPDDVFGKNLTLKYVVDIVSGAVIAYILQDGKVLYAYSGNCAYQIPVTGLNYSEMIRSAVQGIAMAGVGLATGGMAAPMAAGALAGTAINTAISKPQIQKSGSLGGNAGYLGIGKPFIIIYAPNQCLPNNMPHYTGYPSMVTAALGSLTGFTVVDSIHLDGIGATDSEKDEIMAALKEGVLL